MDQPEVSLRDHIERLLSDQSAFLTSQIAHLEQKIDQIRSSNETALKIQAAETERRLEALNGEAGRISKVLELSIPREVHERDVATLSEKIASLTASRDVASGRTLQTGVLVAIAFSVVSAIGTAISIVVNLSR